MISQIWYFSINGLWSIKAILIAYSLSSQCLPKSNAENENEGDELMKK